MSDIRGDERDTESRYAENDRLRGELAVEVTRGELRRLKRERGSSEVSEMLKSGAIKLVKRGYDHVRSTSREKMAETHGVGSRSSSRLQDLNDPTTWGPGR